jgi:cytochrome c
VTEKPKPSKKPNGAVVLTIALVIIFVFIFAIAFVVSSTSSKDAPVIVTEDTYRAEVDNALEGADPTIGEQLITQHICVVCHVSGNGTIAPFFVGIANRAGDRHPPLAAEQYIYESIMYPSNFVVEEYAPSMPQHYGGLLTQQEIGHIIAYLMTLTEEPDES